MHGLAYKTRQRLPAMTMTLHASFRTKLQLLTIVPLAVALIVTFVAVMQTVAKDVEQRARESLTIGSGVAREYLQARHEQLRTSIEVVAADYGLKEAAATSDAQTIRSVLENHGRRVGADVAALLDLDGRTVGSTSSLGSSMVIDASQLDDNSAFGVYETTAAIGDAIYHVYTVPLRAPVTIGWVVFGFQIDDSIAERIAALTGLDATIVRNDSSVKTISSTGKRSPVGVSATAPFDGVYTATGESGQALLIQTPFVAGNSSVLVVLELSLLDAMQPYVQARQGLMIFGGILLMLVALAAAWFSTTITRPLRTLGNAAARMKSGKYDSNVRVDSQDEFGELANSFNAMQLAIAEREEQITHSALHDPLTDLPNRTAVLDRLDELIKLSRASNSTIAVLSIRFLGISEISSTLGYDATDELIRMAVMNLDANAAGLQMLAQTGTNEFALLLPGCDVAEAMSYVDRIEGILGSGVTLGRMNVVLQTEIGIAEFPQHGKSASDLLRLASIARTDAGSSHERVGVYQAGREDDFRRRMRIVSDLPAALRRGDVQTWYQPKAALPGGEICGAEALVRWQHAEFGFLNPDDFIAAAEQAGTIVILTRHVIEAAVRQCCQWQLAGHSLQISVNISARDLLDDHLPFHVLQVLEEHGLPAERLTLEVTESSIMENLHKAVSVLNYLREMGVKISMDDFGTGHSSLAQLRSIPLDELKIDKSFLFALRDDTQDSRIIETIVNLAHGMQLTVVAEGIEDEKSLREIAAMGCEQAQGYFISKPLASQHMLSWLASYQPCAYEDRRGATRAFASGAA